MGTLGKILLFVNLLAAAGVTYLLAQDWSKRQNLSATALRYYLTLQGLPVAPPKEAASGGEVPLPVETTGTHVTETVRPKFLEGYFQGADGGEQFRGGPVNSQVDEVRRVRAKVEEQLRAGGPADKLALLCGRFTPQGFAPGWLAQMAESFDEREAVRRLAAAAQPQPGQPAGDPAALQQAADAAELMIRKRFDAIINEPNPRLADEDATRVKEAADGLRAAAAQAGEANKRFLANQNDQAAAQGLTAALEAMNKASAAYQAVLTDLGTAASRDASDRRRRAAHLLIHLDKEAAWQKRVALVVGLRAYLTAVQDQVNNLRDIAASVQQQIVLDQADFTESYEVLKTLANERALLLDRQKGATADLAAQRNRDLEAVQQRLTQLQRRQQDLTDLQGQVAAALNQQAEVEKTLFDLEKQVGAAMDRNFQLEDRLRAAEKGKAGGQ